MAGRLKNSQIDTVLYLYGISATAKELKQRVPGVDGQGAIEQVRVGELTCWISRVSREDFADNLGANIENLEWLTEMTPRHQTAVAAISEISDVLPTRFGTVFLNETSLAADINRRKRVLLADLKRTQGNEEWGVKVFAGQLQPVHLPKVHSGKGYLEAKSALLKSRKPAGDDEELSRFAKELEKIAVDATEGGKISGGQRDLRYQTSLLLKRSDRKRFQAVLKKFANAWGDSRRIECTGPWPPYSFVSGNSD